MTIDSIQQAGLMAAAEPLRKWLLENGHPHAAVVVEPDSVKLHEVICSSGPMASPEAARPADTTPVLSITLDDAKRIFGLTERCNVDKSVWRASLAAVDRLERAINKLKKA